MAQTLQFPGRMTREWQRGLRSAFNSQLLSRSRDGESLVVQQLLDAQYGFDLFAAIHALAGAAFHRLQLRELGFPKTQHVGRQLAKRGDLANSEIQLVGNDDVI